MFIFSSKTVTNKEFKLLDILRQIKADKETKLDAQKIDKIFLSNVINSNSINSQEDEMFKEIYIFTIYLNKKELPKLFIEALDKSIRFHTYFVFKYENIESTTMCFKEIGTKIKIGKYYFHPFDDIKNIELPIINSVAEVYKCLYSYEVELPYREYETPNEYLTRVNKIHKLQFQISKTEAAIIHQVQPKKKFEYHTRLQEYKKELNELLKVEE